jgi:hypothetical protein
MKNATLLILATLTLLTSVSLAHAEKDLDPDGVGFKFGSDSTGAKEAKIDGSIHFAENDEFFLSAESAEVKDSANQVQSLKTFEGDLTTDSNARWSGGAGLKWAGLNSIFSETTLRIPFKLKTKNWIFDVVPAHGTIRFLGVKRKNGGVAVANLNTTDNSISLAATYKLQKKWDFRISTEAHSFGQHVNQLINQNGQGPIGNNTRTLAQTLFEYENSVSVTDHFEKIDVEGSYSISKAAFDSSLSQTVSLSLDDELSESWSANGEISSTQSDATTSTTGTPSRSTALMIGATYAF